MDFPEPGYDAARDPVVNPTTARRPHRRRAVVLLWIIGVSSMVLTGIWASGAAANGSTPPVVHEDHAIRAATTTTVTSTTPPTTTVPPTTTTAPPPPVTTTTAPPPPTTQPPPPPPPPAPASAPAAPPPGYGCAAALAYLASNAAPGFTASCPGPDDGHQATTTAYFSNGVVTGTIGIVDPCPAAYMNEAHNSWVLRAQYMGTPIPDGLGTAIDPYGYCH